MTVASALLSVSLAALACVSFSSRDRPPAAAGTIRDLAWLAHDWASSATPDLLVEERWTPGSGGAMLAVSRTITDDRMIGFEYLRIVERSGGLVYIAQPNGQPPTEFVMTARTSSSATFENPTHDFPKMIHYALQPDGTLVARVSDGGPTAESVVYTRVR